MDNNTMTRTITANVAQGKTKTSLGKMWAYFFVWVAFITLGVFCMANCDRGTVNTATTSKIEKKTAKQPTSDNRLAKK